MKSKSVSLPKNLPKLDVQALANDFRNLNPNDPGSWPTAPKAALLSCLFVLTLAVGWLLMWSDELTELEAKQRDEETLKLQYLDKKKQAVNMDLYVQQLAEIDRSFGALLKQLPSKSEVEDLLIEVNQSGLGRGLQFELFRPGQEQVLDFYAELPVTVRIAGAYHDFGAFAADIAKLPRIVTLNNISITATPGKGGGMILSMDALTKTFRYLEGGELERRGLATSL